MRISITIDITDDKHRWTRRSFSSIVLGAKELDNKCIRELQYKMIQTAKMINKIIKDEPNANMRITQCQS